MKDMIKNPQRIEDRSMEIITEQVGELGSTPQQDKVIKRVIHATADFDFAKLIVISQGAIDKGLEALRSGANIVSDVNMLKSGINKRRLGEYGGKVNCFIADEEVVKGAKELGITRSMMAMRMAVQDENNKVFAIGNAPTALFELIRLVREGKAKPALIVGTPVGFVGAKESKEELEKMDISYITARGRKGGSPVAASIVNAMLYMDKKAIKS